METIPRRSGVTLDKDRFDYELAIRAIPARKLAELSGVHEVILSRARRGQPIATGTLRKITQALLRVPTLPGAELLVTRPENTKAVAEPAAPSGEPETKKRRRRVAG